MDAQPDKLPPLLLERWLLGEVSDAERRRVEARLSPEEQQRLRAQDTGLRQQLMAADPPLRFGARVRELARLSERETLRSPWLLAAASVACLLALAVGLPALVRGPNAKQDERAKGLDFELRVYRQRAGHVERVASGSEVAAHERVQLGYVRADHSHGVLLSIDGRARVTLHQPSAPGDSSALPPGSGELLLRESYELDDAPEFERFVFIGADQPIRVDTVLQAARALAADPARVRSADLPLTFPHQQRSLLVRKSPAR